MTVQPQDLYDLLLKIRYDTTAIQAKVTDALRTLNALNLPVNPPAECPHCGIELTGPIKLAEHLYQTHNGPTPEHWAALEQKVLPPAERDEILANLTATAPASSTPPPLIRDMPETEADLTPNQP